ncbi:MAG TPA: FixH family protein [Ktedonobacteraceae bacterium]|nr:FixH family protein [Ktedonobacteraceae bacterium]
MRVRPFFWFLLLLSCVGILVFAATNHMHAPAILQVHVSQQHLTSQDSTILELHLTDPQGIPIEDAQVLSDAHMTNMAMATRARRIEVQGHGAYLVRFSLVMAGPWAITIQARADGFTPLQQTLFLEIS